jgi:hypothetical protein
MTFNGRYPSAAGSVGANTGVLPRDYGGAVTGVRPGDYTGVDNGPEEGDMNNSPFRLAETVGRVFDRADRAREYNYVPRRRVVEFEPVPSG